METASWVLLIVVSSFMTIFLIVLIVAGIQFIKILKQVRRISERAEDISVSVENAANTFERAASPFAVIKLIGKIVDQASKANRRRR